jgi:hypothetical protein
VISLRIYAVALEEVENLSLCVTRLDENASIRPKACGGKTEREFVLGSIENLAGFSDVIVKVATYT